MAVSSAPPHQHLFLMRHAHALSRNAAVSDFDRPLSARGQREAAEAAAWLAAQEPKPEKIVASTAARTSETAAIAMATIGLTEISWLPALYRAELGAWLQLIEHHFDGRPLLLIGHNPVLEQGMRHLLAAGEESLFGYFPTAAVAHLCSPPAGVIAGSFEFVSAFQPTGGRS